MRALRTIARTAVEQMVVRFPRRFERGRLVLAYHNIATDPSAIRGDQSLHLSRTAFDEQLRIAAQEADVVPLESLLKDWTPTDRLVAITFDDAYRGAIENGLAGCRSIGAHCTVFVTPGLLGRVPEWDIRASRGEWSDDDRKRFLWGQRGLTSVDAPSADAWLPRIASEDELLSLASETTVSFGNHTMRHANLGALQDDEVVDEVTQAQAWLLRAFPKGTSDVVAYPYGIAPNDSALRRLHSTSGLLVQGGWFRTLSDHHRIPRWNVPAGVSPTGFRARLRGWLTR